MAACVLVPFLFWHGAWFGRVLEDPELELYLKDSEKPRRIQHALSQIAERMDRRDPKVREWYPALLELSGHPTPEVRVTLAWVLGQDPDHPPFHAALLSLLGDEDLLVRRNAALALVRFGDPSGLAELRAMLLPRTITAPSPGIIRYRVDPGEWIGPGTLLAEVEGDLSQSIEAETDSGVLELLAREGSRISAGDPVILLSADPSHVWESLRALSLVGGEEELTLVESVARDRRFSEETRRQASLTSQAIRDRIH